MKCKREKCRFYSESHMYCDELGKDIDFKQDESDLKEHIEYKQYELEKLVKYMQELEKIQDNYFNICDTRNNLKE